VDEMMVPYKGKTSRIKQYIRAKPHPWGFKIWARTTITGILCDFDVYQGGDGSRSELGQGADVVLKLCDSLTPHCNYKVYADNFFTSVPLIEKLLERGIHYVGTVRPNRLSGCILKTEKELKTSGRGSFDLSVETSSNIAAVRWFDSKAVTLLSTYVSAEPVNKAKRWDKKLKTYVTIDKPAIVHEYNQFMGGIDLLDGLLAKYRYRMKSKRWYMYLFWHSLMIAVVNAWLLYRRDCRSLQLPKSSILNRRRFQAEVASCLINVNAAKKRGRPSVDEVPTKVLRVIHNGPCDQVRKDSFAHWPVKDTKRGRCKVCKKNQTNTLCEKCDVRLCFTEERNCFRSFHIH